MNQEDSLRTEIHQVLDEVSGPTPDLMPEIAQRLRPASRRRPLLAIGQVAAVLAIALVVGGVVFAMHRSRQTAQGPLVSTSPTTPVAAGPGANIAWVIGQTPNHADVVTGIDPAGHVVGTINAPVELRSPVGAHLYALSSGAVDVYSAVDGHREQTIRLHAVRADVPSLPLLSPDGRYLTVTEGSPTTLEVVDLSLGRSLASIRVDSVAYGAAVIDAQAQHVYVMGGSSLAKLSFDGATLRVEQQAAAPPCDGLSLGGGNTSGGLPFRLLADGRTFVAFCPGDGRVSWFDLVSMKLTHEVVVEHRNPFWVSPVFSVDGNTLYLHEGGTGKLHAVDLLQQKIVKSTKVAIADTNPLAWLRSLLVTDADAGGIPRTAALSPDGSWLYAIGAFGAPGGVSLVHLPDLSVKGRWLPEGLFTSVWVSADGQTIYLHTEGGNELRVLRTDGSPVATLSLTADWSDFIAPTVP